MAATRKAHEVETGHPSDDDVSAMETGASMTLDATLGTPLLATASLPVGASHGTRYPARQDASFGKRNYRKAAAWTAGTFATFAFLLAVLLFVLHPRQPRVTFGALRAHFNGDVEQEMTFHNPNFYSLDVDYIQLKASVWEVEPSGAEEYVEESYEFVAVLKASPLEPVQARSATTRTFRMLGSDAAGVKTLREKCRAHGAPDMMIEARVQTRARGTVFGMWEIGKWYTPAPCVH